MKRLNVGRVSPKADALIVMVLAVLFPLLLCQFAVAVDENSFQTWCDDSGDVVVFARNMHTAKSLGEEIVILRNRYGATGKVSVYQKPGDGNTYSITAANRLLIFLKSKNRVAMSTDMWYELKPYWLVEEFPQ